MLVVANQTVGGRALLDEIKRRVAGEDAQRDPGRRAAARGLGRRALVVGRRRGHPRTPASAWRRRWRRCASAGLEVRGRLGDHHDPNQDAEDALRTFAADEVIISTHTPQRSRWLESGVVEKARSELPQPVTHVVVDLEAEAAGTGEAA